jgi:hypothetical protein
MIANQNDDVNKKYFFFLKVFFLVKKRKILFLRLIVNDDEKQNIFIKTNWTELKHFVRCIYRQTGTGISG